MIDASIPEVPSASTEANGASRPSVRTLLLTDLVDSTKLVQKLGDEQAANVFSRHDRMARDLLATFNGREIDKTDGFLFLFESPNEAVGYALAYHQALAALSMDLAVQLRARAGVHHGELFLRQNNAEDIARGAKPIEVEGLAKPLAARLMSLAGPKQTLITEDAFNLARAADEEIDDEIDSKWVWLAHGPYRFHGIAETTNVFEVGISGQSLLQVPPDSPKAKRAVAPADELTLGWRPAAGLTIPRRSDWVLADRLGQGGYGEVWLATHATTRESRVFKFCFDADRLRSLMREVTMFRLLREALGRRSDVVRLLDWSFDEAPYFLEEEYVEGGDLAHWAEHHGGIAEIPLAQRLEIVARVADALSAAHSIGILHRDLKPGNILISKDSDDAFPQIKLGDFGVSEVDEKAVIARGITAMGLTEATSAGSDSSTRGTLMYLAPEVAEGSPASVQSDIYALGLVLYQSVAGDFKRSIGHGWERGVPDDLLVEDIAACVDRNPERRLGSAGELARRLRSLAERREQRDTELQAREEAERTKQALERARNRRRVLSFISAAAVVVLTVVSILAVQAIRARDEAQRAQAVADSRREQAEGLISFLLGDLRSKLSEVGRLDILDEVGDQALEYFAAVPEGDVTDEELLGRSRALYQIGEVRISQGKLDGALTPLEESLELARALVQRHPQDGQRLFELGQAHYWVGHVHWRRRQLDEAQEQFMAYLDVSERLMAIDAANQDWQLELSYAYSNLAFLLQERGDYAGAEERFLACLEIQEALLASDPGNQGWLRAVGSTHNAIAVVMKEQGRPRESLERHRKELAMREALVELAPDNMNWQHLLAVGHNRLGGILASLGATDEALVHYERAKGLLETLVAQDRANMTWLRDLAIQESRASRLLRSIGVLDQALEYARSGVRRMEVVFAADETAASRRRDFARTQITLAEALLTSNQSVEPVQLSDSAIVHLDQLLAAGRQSRSALQLRSRARILRGQLLERSGDIGAARDSWELALADIEPVAQTSRNIDVLEIWVRCLLLLDREEEARSVVSALKNVGYRGAEMEIR